MDDRVSRVRLARLGLLFISVMALGVSVVLVIVRRHPWAMDSQAAGDTAGYALAVSNNGAIVIRVLTDMGQDGMLFGAVGHRAPVKLVGHAKEITSASFSPDGKLVATASRDGTSRVWDVATGSPVHTLERDPWWDEVLDVAFSPDGRIIATANADGSVRLWDANSGKAIKAIKEDGAAAHSVNFSPAGDRLASSDQDYSARIWSVQTGQETVAVKGFSQPTVCDVAFSPNGRLLAAAGEDGSVHIWDAASGAEQVLVMAHEGGSCCVAFFPDGLRFITGGTHDRTTRVWDSEDGAKLAEINAALDCKHAPFLPGGDRLVLGGGTPTVWVRRFPEWWWGHLHRAEVWASAIFGVLTLGLMGSEASRRIRGSRKQGDA